MAWRGKECKNFIWNQRWSTVAQGGGNGGEVSSLLVTEVMQEAPKGFGFIRAWWWVFTGLNNLLAWGLTQGQSISRLSTPPAPQSRGTSVAQSVSRDLTLLGRTSCTLDPNAMKVAVPRLKAASG